MKKLLFMLAFVPMFIACNTNGTTKSVDNDTVMVDSDSVFTNSVDSTICNL